MFFIDEFTHALQSEQDAFHGFIFNVGNAKFLKPKE